MTALAHGGNLVPIELKSITPTNLRAVGLDEKWLQDRVRDDPTLLGLGELEVISKEHRQPSGGRIDFLMYNAEIDTFYEIEIMLGALDERHIIRTIEYWDIERQRRPNSEHRAVIVAEQITSRFFNVVRLLNRAVPIVAIQLASFKLDDTAIVVHPVKVLDVVEEASDPDVSDQVVSTDRAYWEQRRDAETLAMVDQIVERLTENGIRTRITYNKHHIAVGSTGTNFAWLYYRSTPETWFMQIKMGNEDRDTALAALQSVGFGVSPGGSDDVKFQLTKQKLQQHMALLIFELLKAEKHSL